MPISKQRARERHQKSERMIRARYTIICPYCLRKISQTEVSVDHVKPRSRFDETNTVKCCKKCNNEKGALTDAEYKLWKELSDSKQKFEIWQHLENIRNGLVK